MFLGVSESARQAAGHWTPPATREHEIAVAAALEAAKWLDDYIPPHIAEAIAQKVTRRG